MLTSRFFGAFLGALVWSIQLVWAASDLGSAPVCLGWKNQPLAINNEQVLHWKRTTKNQFNERGHISGPILQVYKDKTNHAHFAVQIGNNPNDLIEVIYNEDFGVLPDLSPGMSVEACGDYITSTAQSGSYPPSPAGAIIHWVHATTKPTHAPGFLIINGALYGQDVTHAGPKQYPNPPKKNKQRIYVPGDNVPAMDVMRILKHPEVVRTVRKAQNKYGVKCEPPGADEVQWRCQSSQGCSFTAWIVCTPQQSTSGITPFRYEVVGIDDGRQTQIQNIKAVGM